MLIQHRLPGCDTEAAHAVRAAVFQAEQGIPSTSDFDGLDAIAEQFVAFDAGRPIGTARYRLLEDGTAKVERVAVLSDQRGKKVGLAIMNAIEVTARRQNIPTLVLGSQVSATDFYERIGYQRQGSIFEEVGLPHVMMSLDVRHPNEADPHYWSQAAPYTYAELHPPTGDAADVNGGAHSSFRAPGVHL